MQKSIWHDNDLSPCSNYFCDVEKSLFFEFVDHDFGVIPQQEYTEFMDEFDVYNLYKYFLMKNLFTGVSELALRARQPKLAFEVMKEFDMTGFVLSEYRKLDYFFQTDKVKPAIYIDNLLDLSEKQIDEISDCSAKQKTPLFLSYLIDLEDTGELNKMFELDPLLILNEFGLLDRELYLVGCNYLDRCDFDCLMTADKVTIVSTPTTDMQLGRGMINFYPLVQNWLNIKLGSGQNPNIDLLWEARIAVGNTANAMKEPNGKIAFDEVERWLKSSHKSARQVTEEELAEQKEKVKNIFEKYIAKNIFGGKTNGNH